jgi:hypothetical protein
MDKEIVRDTEESSAEEKTPEEMTDEELRDQVEQLVGTAPTGEQKQGVHQFLHNVATAEDTTKLGNLTAEEVGTPKHPIRTYKELALYCSDVANMGYMAKYFLSKSEIVTSTSLSKDAKLINLAVVTRRESKSIEDKPRAINKGWFSKKPKINEVEEA